MDGRKDLWREIWVHGVCGAGEQRTRDGKSRPRVNSRQWQTMRGVTKALSSLRPTGCCSVANIPVLGSLAIMGTKGEGTQEDGGRGGVPHQLHGKLRSHYLCAYTHRHGLHQATPHFSAPGYRWPDKEDINNAFCTDTTAILSIGRPDGRVRAYSNIRISDA